MKYLIKEIQKLGFKNNILEQLSEEIKASGFAGNTNIPELVYLAMCTSMLNNPMSIVLKGPSGAGKSFNLNAGKQFIPETAYSQFEGMSEKALVYLKDLDLKHKHLVIGEAAGMADGNGRALLRQLLSEGSVTYATVQSTDKEGLKGSTLPTLEGPCGLLMTTTANSLHPEDESRMLSIELDESPDQIRQALRAQALGAIRRDKPVDVARWHELFNLINAGPKEVIIPYAEDLVERLPVSHDRIKRDFPQILSLIKAHALMHSFVRERADESTVIANEDDYAAVYRLLNVALSQGLDKSVSTEIKELVNVVKQNTKGKYSSGISQTALAKKLNREQYAVSRTVDKATKLGYLINKNPGQGKVAELVCGEEELPDETVLPHPMELFGLESMRWP